MKQKYSFPLTICTLTLTSLLSACNPRIDVRGNLIDPQDIAAAQSEKLSKNDILRRFGSPTNVATFSSERWYYVGGKTASLAFFRPKLIDQQVVAVAFDKNGLVSKINVYRLEDGKIIDPVKRTTPTEGQELTFLQQLLGNLGKFTKP